MAQVVDFDADGQERIGVTDRPAVPTMASTGACPQACKPARSAAFLRCEWSLARWTAPEEPRVFDAKVDVEERGYQRQHDDEAQGVIVFHELDFFLVCAAYPASRASRAGAQAAGDRRASFVRRNAESGGYIEQDGLHVAVGECLGRNEPTEAKGGEVQSSVALADRGLQELLFFRSKSGRGVATMRPGWREWCSGSRYGESLEQPGRQAGQGNLVRSGAILPGIDV